MSRSFPAVCCVCVCVRISGRRNVDGHRTYGSLPDSAFFHSFVCQTSLFQLKIVYQVITWLKTFNFYYYWMKLLPFQFWEYHLVRGGVDIGLNVLRDARNSNQKIS